MGQNISKKRKTAASAKAVQEEKPMYLDSMIEDIDDQLQIDENGDDNNYSQMRVYRHKNSLRLLKNIDKT